MKKKSVYFEERLKNENPFVEDRYLTSLEKVQMITMLGIIRRRLRLTTGRSAIHAYLSSLEMRSSVRFVNN